MSNFDNGQILTELNALKNQLNVVNQRFYNIAVLLKQSEESITAYLKLVHQTNYGTYFRYKDQHDLQEKKRIHENLSRQLKSMHQQFLNIQHAVHLWSMQVGAFYALLKQASFDESMDQRVRKVQIPRRAKHAPSIMPRGQLQAILDEEEEKEKRRTEEMAQKARIFPFHLTP